MLSYTVPNGPRLHQASLRQYHILVSFEYLAALLNNHIYMFKLYVYIDEDTYSYRFHVD